MDNTKTFSKAKSLVYPILFAIYPGLTLASHNLGEMELSDSFRTLAASLLLASFLLIAFYLYFRDWQSSAFMTLIILVLFFTYGHVYYLLRETSLFGIVVFRHRVLGLLWAGLFILGFSRVSRKSFHPEKIAPTLNVVTIAALIIPVWNIAAYQSRATEFDEVNLARQEENIELEIIRNGENLPDIYYIILDGYSRDDYLLEFFEYDNSPFLDWLSEKGFYLAECSQSNYAQSIFSISSTLNLEYIDSFYDASFVNDYQSNRYKQGLKNFLKQSQVRVFLEQRGYLTVAIESGESFSNITDADKYYSSENKTFWQRIFEGLNEYEVLLIRNTAVSFVSAISPTIADRMLHDLNFPNKVHRERILFAFDVLEEIPRISQRKFVFAHIVSPHEPFVFGPEGEIVEWEPGFKVGYPNQINYLNIRVKELIENILELSKTAPIIILQGDHGAKQFVGEEGRMAILNAYYFPEDTEIIVYDSISPVNTFRVIFNEYFGQDFELLEDKSLYSSYLYPLDYLLIPPNSERCQ